MRKLILLFSALVLCIGVVFGQGKTVSGRVIDENNEPAIGASIQVKGAETVGTISDFDGNFTITLPTGTTHLIVSYVGYTTVEQEAKDGMVVRLTTDAEVLDEVMVVAYGTSTKKAFAGSATVVKSETLEKKNPTDVSKALAGEVAGVQVVSTSGQPGTSASIQIRGVGSLGAGSSPLYVVDGVPFEGDIAGIDPGDIASTTILKDATATSLYGSRGANGVILITTKKGTSGESGKIEVDLKYGANMRLIPLYNSITSPEQYMELSYESIYNQMLFDGTADGDGMIGSVHAGEKAAERLFSDTYGINEYYNRWGKNAKDIIDCNKWLDNGQINPNFGKFRSGVAQLPGYETDPGWQKSLFRTGQKYEATVKISGGSEKTTYYTSFGYLKDQGYYIGSDYSRATARVNVSHEAKKWLKGSMNMNYSYSVFDNPGQEGGGAMNNGFLYVNQCPSIYPVYQYQKVTDAEGNVTHVVPVVDPRFDNQYMYDSGDGIRTYGMGITPAGALKYDKQRSYQHQFIGNAMLEATLYKGLKLIANVGATYVGGTGASLTNNYYGDAMGVGRIYKQSTHYLMFTALQQLAYNNDFGGDHDFNAFVAHETQYVNSTNVYGNKSYIVRPDGLELGNAVVMDGTGSSTSTSTMESYFGEVRYRYKERYGIHGTVRADGSSKFARGHRWGTFGGVGLTWTLSNESFMQGVNLLRDFKVKASWGVLGNQNIGSYGYTNLYSIINVEDKPGIVQSSVGVPSLTWESSNMVNAGIEFSLGKYLTVEAEYFYKYTSDMLWSLALAPSIGFGSISTNDGIMSNQGAEFQLYVHAVNTNAVKLDIRLNGTHYVNKMEKMPVDALGNEMAMNGSMALGHSYFDHYMSEYVGVDKNGLANYTMYYDPELYATAEAALENISLSSIPSVHKYILENKKDHPKYNEYLKTSNADLILDKTHTSEYSYASNFYLGKSYIPKLYGGFGIDLTVYGVDLSANFQYQLGGYGYDNVYASLMHSDQAGSRNWHQDMYTNRWTEAIGATMKEGELRTDISPRLSNGTDQYANASSTRFLTSSNYLSLSNVTIGYSFPKKWMEKAKLNSLRLSVAADNLFCLSVRKGFIPMASMYGTSDASQYTPLSSIIGTIKISF